MLAFIFDGTFEGLLSAVFDAYTLKRFPDALLRDDETPPLIVEALHTVITNRENAERVFSGLKKRLSLEGNNVLLLAFLSEEPGIGTLLFRYIRNIFDRADPAEGDFTDPVMLDVDRIARNVYREHHLMLGFARFQKTAEGIYFAALNLKYNTLSLMLPHFRDRFASEQWILYDAGRGFGFFHDRGEIKDMTLDGSLLMNGRLPDRLLAKDERMFQELWQNYFIASAVSERVNPKLQARCMPRRYWPYMTEMQPRQGVPATSSG